VSEALAAIRAYHRATRHDFRAYARGPGGLDWATQPDPFRRYEGAPLLRLDHVPVAEGPRYGDVLGGGEIAPEPVTRRSISRLFEDSLALSAWKEAGSSRWSLRVDPSSGNLHPTEGYLLCGSVEGLTKVPILAHYAPLEHALELRATPPDLPPGRLYLGITSIHWREAWKYGERAFRYCQHDCGHVIACFTIAAAGLGWKAALCDDLGYEDLAALLGVKDAKGAEPEEPECLIAIDVGRGLPPVPVAAEALELRGEPNRLSPDHVDWHAVEDASLATRKPRTQDVYAAERNVAELSVLPPGGEMPLRKILRQRRSAVAFDGNTSIAREEFLRVLAATCRGPARVLPWAPRVHLGLLVHRVRGVEPGLYFLARDPAELPQLRSAMQRPLLWRSFAEAPEGLDLFHLATGDLREVARAVSCHQEIASDGCFAVAMLAEFDPALDRHGAWFYRRLFWECGVVGQVLYLEAEAIGVRATGIGCFFDEPAHEVFGIASSRYRSLYHFTVGGPVEDARLQTSPPYPPAP